MKQLTEDYFLIQAFKNHDTARQAQTAKINRVMTNKVFMVSRRSRCWWLMFEPASMRPLPRRDAFRPDWTTGDPSPLLEGPGGTFASCLSDEIPGPRIIALHDGQGPLTPASPALTESLRPHSGQTKTRYPVDSEGKLDGVDMEPLNDPPVRKKPAMKFTPPFQDRLAAISEAHRRGRQLPLPKLPRWLEAQSTNLRYRAWRPPARGA